MTTADILSKLISFRTDNEVGLSAATNFIQSELTRVGFTCQRTPHALLAINRDTWQCGNDNVLVLSGHIDVVPAPDEMFIPRFVDGVIYGRGAVDMLGFCAASVSVAPELKHMSRPIVLVYTMDEESCCDGIKEVAEILRKYGCVPGIALLGEPTNARPCIGSAGIRTFKTCVRGCATHSSTPNLGINAIYVAARLVRDIESLATRAPRNITINVGRINGGRADNIVADYAMLTWEIRGFDDTVSNAVYQDFQRSVNEITNLYDGSDIETVEFFTMPVFKQCDDTPLIRVLMCATGERPITLPYSTEAGYYQSLGADTVIFGPGDSSMAHADIEYIKLSDLDRYEKQLIQILKNI